MRGKKFQWKRERERVGKKEKTSNQRKQKMQQQIATCPSVSDVSPRFCFLWRSSYCCGSNKIDEAHVSTGGMALGRINTPEAFPRIDGRLCGNASIQSPADESGARRCGWAADWTGGLATTQGTPDCVRCEPRAWLECADTEPARRLGLRQGGPTGRKTEQKQGSRPCRRDGGHQRNNE